MGFPRASRVEEVQEIQIRKLFGGGFWRGNTNAGIHKYIVECFAPPARARTSSPSLRRFTMFLKTARDGLLVRGRVGGPSTSLCIYGSLHLYFAFEFPSKKSSLQKSSALNFANLTLHAREARGTAKPHWLSLMGGKESQCENDLVPILVSIYNSARTYFTNNPD